MSASPAEYSLPVRRPSFDLSEDLPRYWFRGEPFATHVFDALSSVFPPGEAYFVRSVQRFQDEIEDPALRKAIRAFAGQEGQHSHQHDRHVKLLLEQGYDSLAWRNDLVRRMSTWSIRRLPRFSLAGTAALEHLTALLARQLLSQPERWAEGMDPRMVPLWQWHALEEAEHKAVAYDVLQRVAPGYALRATSLAMNTVGLFVEIMDRVVYMLWKDGLLFRRRVWADGLRFLFGRGGLLRGHGRDYWRWYRRDFHPNEVDDGALITSCLKRIEAQLA
ncbi:MAG: metal-dependent hydrolase [Deltaproteobacteria bacterium]|jgi:hypothetical protein|nr:metal-dependent hydrolase [Deltaproteobacteria bacterium]